jgi:hypothetical protein
MANITIKRSIKRPKPQTQRRIGPTTVLTRAPRKLEQWEIDAWDALSRGFGVINRSNRRR